jgi:uncharacterized membrane protein YkvA (DUF1232 family)
MEAHPGIRISKELPMGKFIDKWKLKARQLKIEVYALYLAYRDPRVPWFARFFAGLVVGYALSPIDLIPDFIPVIGYLDDLILVPLGIKVALSMIPKNVIQESRDNAARIINQGLPVNKVAAALIITVWLLLAIALIVFLIHVFKR